MRVCAELSAALSLHAIYPHSFWFYIPSISTSVKNIFSIQIVIIIQSNRNVVAVSYFVNVPICVVIVIMVVAVVIIIIIIVAYPFFFLLYPFCRLMVFNCNVTRAIGIQVARIGRAVVDGDAVVLFFCLLIEYDGFWAIDIPINPRVLPKQIRQF